MYADASSWPVAATSSALEASGPGRRLGRRHVRFWLGLRRQRELGIRGWLGLRPAASASSAVAAGASSAAGRRGELGLRRRSALIAINSVEQEDHDDQQDPDRTRQVALVEEHDLRPDPPLLAAVGEP